MTFLDKLSDKFLTNPFFECNRTSKAKWKSIQPHDFIIKHYAGPVTYTVHGFMDKNNNNLYRNLKELMLTSQNSIVKAIYSLTELNDIKKTDTVGSQFRTGLKKLMQILYSKEPSYVRCIKSNHNKKSSNFRVY